MQNPQIFRSPDLAQPLHRRPSRQRVLVAEGGTMTHARRILLLLLLIGGTTPAADARTLEIFPSNADATCNEEFENVASTLLPGDELVLHGGVYTQRCRRLVTGLHGTAESPIVIRAATGETPILTRPGNAN